MIPRQTTRYDQSGRGLVALLVVVLMLPVTALALMAWIYLTYQDEDYRQLLTTVVNHFSEYHLSIDGDFHLQITERLTVEAGDVRLSSLAGDMKIDAGRLVASLELRPLLSRLLEIHQLHIEQVNIDIDESLAPEETPVDSTDDGSGVFITPIVHDFALKTIRLNYRGRGDPRPVEFFLEQLAIKEFSETRPLRVTAHGQISGSDFTLDGTLGDLASLLEGTSPYPASLAFQLPAGSLSLDGQVGNPHQGTGLDFQLHARVPAVEKLAALVHLQMPPLGELSFSTRIQGSLQAPELSDADLELQHDGLAINARGSIREPLALRGIDLQFDSLISNRPVLEHYLAEYLPSAESVSLSALLQSDENNVAVKGLSARLTAGKGLVATLGGQAVAAPRAQALKYIDARLEYRAQDSSAIRHFNAQVPLVGPVQLKAQLAGDAEQLSITGIDLRAGSEQGIELGAGGQLSLAELAGTLRLSSLDLHTTLTAVSTAELAKLGDIELPDLGKVNAGANLTLGRGDALALRNVDVRIDSAGKRRLRAKGSIDSLAPFSGLDLRIDASASSLKDMGEPWKIELPDAGTVNFSGRVDGNADNLSLGGKFALARTHIQTDIDASFTGPRPQFKGRLAIPVLHISDIGVQPIRKESTAAPPDDSDAPRLDKQALDLAGLKTVDTDLKISIGKIEGTRKLFDNLDTHIRLDDGLLELSPFRLTYEGGRFEARATVNSRRTPPALALNIQGQELGIGTLLEQREGEDVAIRGDLTSDIDLTSHGLSPADLAANLGGHINLMSENTSVKKQYVELLVKDVLGWALSRVSERRRMIDFDCSLLVSRVQGGVIETETFVLDSPEAEIRADASVDLGRETLDAIIYPQRKRRLFSKVEPIIVSGPWSSPTVKATTLAELSTTAAKTAVLTPVLLSADLLEGVIGRQAKKHAGGCDRFLQDTSP